MKITGITLDQFIEITKNAFSLSGISDVKRDSVAKRFLTKQLFPNQNPGENEDRLHEIFEPESNTGTDAFPQFANVVIFESYEFGEHGGLELENTDSFICMTKEATNKRLEDLFRSNYPDHVDGEYLLDGHMMISDYIEVHTDNEEEEEALRNKVSEMDCNEVLEWLVDSFDIDDLVQDSFFSDYLNQGLYKLRWENSELFY